MHKFLSITTFLVACLSVFSQSVFAHHIGIANSHIRATIPGTPVSSAYMTINNRGDKKIALTKVTSSFSERMELHQHIMEDGMMKMRQIEQIEVPAKGQAVLQPSGLHIMIFDLKKPLKDGESQDIEFHFDDGSRFLLKIPVISIKKQMAAHKHH